MKRLLLLVCGGISLLLAQAPRFIGPFPVNDAGVPIDVGYYAAPLMTDWDGDGHKDLVTGQYEGGYIRFYRNLGADSSPYFNGYEYLSASGSQINLPYG